MRFGIGDGSEHTLEDVGQSFQVTRERIRQIEAKALRKLRHPSRSRKLKAFLEGSRGGLRGSGGRSGLRRLRRPGRPLGTLEERRAVPDARGRARAALPRPGSEKRVA
jgi:hypothetical protein